MAKRWTLENDKFLAEHSRMFDGAANYVASHDLGFKGKNAGEDRITALKESGVWDYLVKHRQAEEDLFIAWSYTFGSEQMQDVADEILLARKQKQQVAA